MSPLPTRFRVPSPLIGPFQAVRGLVHLPLALALALTAPGQEPAPGPRPPTPPHGSAAAPGPSLAPQPTPPGAKPQPPAKPQAAPPAAAPNPAPAEKLPAAPAQPAPSAPAGPAPAPAQPANPPPALTAQDFLRLWNETRLEDKLTRQRPPVEGVIRSAAYIATVMGPPASPTGLTVQADLQLQSLQKGWSVVPISSRPLPLVNSDAGNAFLTLKDQGYLVVLPDEGTYLVKLTLAFPVTMVEGTPTVQIELPQSPVSTFSGTLPGPGWTVKSDVQRFPIRISPEGTDTGFSFSPGAATSFALQWERPQDDKAREPVIFAETAIRTHLRPDAVRSEAKLALQLPRAPLSSVKVALSPDHELLSIAGEGVKSWQLKTEQKPHQLEIWFATPRRERCELQLALEQAVPQLPFTASLPVIRVEGALRQSGSVEIVEERDVTTVLDAFQNLTRQTSDVRPAAHQRFLGSYRFLRSDYGGALKMAETVPQLSASADTLLRIDDDFSFLSTTLRLQIQGRSVLQTVLVLPAGFTVEKVEGDAVKSFEAKGSRLTVAFLGPQLGTTELELTGKKPRREGAVEEQELPHFTVENALEFRGRVRLDFPPSIQVETRNEASPLALRPAPKSFEYVNLPSPSSLVVTRKAPHVEALAETQVHFKHHETAIRCTLKYQIRNRFPERLLLRIPASLAASMSFQSSTLSVVDRNASPATGAANRGEDESLYTYWAVINPDGTLGEHQVELSVTDKLPDPLYNQPLITPSLLVVPVHADRLEGRLTVSTDENVVLKPVTETAVHAVTGAPAGPDSGPTYEFSSSDADLTFAVTRLRYVELPSLAVDLAEVTHVVAGDGSLSTEIACRLIADQPADLEIQLPPGARLNSQVFCNDKPVSPRQTTEENVLAVTIQPEPKKGAGPAAETLVRFIYDLPSALPSKSLGSRGNLPIPVATLRNAKTLDSRTTLYLPPAYRYYDFTTPMTLQSSVAGWTKAKQYLARLLPSLAAWTSTGTEISEPAAAPQMPPFEYRIPLRKEGQKFTFSYSAPPDAIAVTYLSQRYATLLEAGAFFLALFLGILISRQPVEAKLVFLVFAGLLALVAASFAAPHLATIYHAVCLGAIASVVFWLFAGVIWLFQGLRFRSPRPAPEPYPAFAPAAAPAREGEPEPRVDPSETRQPEPEPDRTRANPEVPAPSSSPAPPAQDGTVAGEAGSGGEKPSSPEGGGGSELGPGGKR